MSKKPTQESIELDQFLSNLTEVELETESKAIFSLCETAREMDFYKNERAVMDSFIEWARSESRKLKGRTNNLDNGTCPEVESSQNAPLVGYLRPEMPLTVRGIEWQTA